MDEDSPDYKIRTASDPVFGAFSWEMAWKKIKQRYIT